MSLPSPTARRFYQAFYTWTVSTAAPPKCPPSTFHVTRRTYRHPITSVRRFYSTDPPTGTTSLDGSSRDDVAKDARGSSIKEHDPNNQEQTSEQETVLHESAESKNKTNAQRLPENDLSDRLRFAMRALVHPVVVITCTSEPRVSSATAVLEAPRSDEQMRFMRRRFGPILDSNELDRCYGATVSSFTSVCLQPEPVISFNLKLPSGTWDILQKSQRFCVNIMRGAPHGARIAQIFAGSHSSPSKPFHDIARDLTDFAWNVSNTAPIMPSRECTLATIEAELMAEKCVAIGDHMIVVAKVMFMPRVFSRNAGWVRALSYGAGKYYSQVTDKQGGLFPLPKGGDLVRLSDPQMEQLPPRFSRWRPGQQISVRPLKNSGLLVPKTANEAPAQQQREFSSVSRIPSERGREVARLAKRLDMVNVPGMTVSHQHRGFATSARHPRRRHFPKQKRPMATLEPSAASMTVCDFFNVPDNGRQENHRIRACIFAQGQIAKFQAALGQIASQPAESGSEDASVRIAEQLRTEETYLARRLAYIAAAELRVMLDKGRINFPRAVILEGQVEKGQSALLADIERVKQSYAAGKIADNVYPNMIGDLWGVYEALQTESVRLRQFVDEEAENGGEDEDF